MYGDAMSCLPQEVIHFTSAIFIFIKTNENLLLWLYFVVVGGQHILCLCFLWPRTYIGTAGLPLQYAAVCQDITYCLL